MENLRHAVVEVDVGRRPPLAQRALVARIERVLAAKAGGRILREEEKFPRARVEDLPRERPPIVRPESTLDGEHALHLLHAVESADISATITETAKDRQLLGGQLEEESFAAVG